MNYRAPLKNNPAAIDCSKPTDPNVLQRIKETVNQYGVYQWNSLLIFIDARKLDHTEALTANTKIWCDKALQNRGFKLPLPIWDDMPDGEAVCHAAYYKLRDLIGIHFRTTNNNNPELQRIEPPKGAYNWIPTNNQNISNLIDLNTSMEFENEE